MRIMIGENIRALRKRKDVTQEKLAGYLGVSCQAVSRWESGIGYPDIETLPEIANFFNITTDELLGVNLEKNEMRIKEYLDEFSSLKYLGDERKSFVLIRSAYAQYPYDWRIVEKYIWQLAYDPDCNGFKEHADELKVLSERILGNCTDDQKRYTALSILSGVYDSLGESEKALEYAKKFPNSYHLTSCEELEQFYKNNQMHKEYEHRIQENIHELTRMLQIKIRNIALETKDPDERIKLHRNSIELFHLIFDKGDYGFCHFDMADAYFWIGNRYIEKGDYDKARENLELSVKHNIAYDTLPQQVTFESSLVESLSFEKTQAYRDFKSKCGLELKHYESGFYDRFRTCDWFIGIIADLEECRTLCEAHINP